MVIFAVEFEGIYQISIGNMDSRVLPVIDYNVVVEGAEGTCSLRGNLPRSIL